MPRSVVFSHDSLNSREVEAILPDGWLTTLDAFGTLSLFPPGGPRKMDQESRIDVTDGDTVVVDGGSVEIVFAPSHPRADS